MKKLLLVVLMLVCGTAYAQPVYQNNPNLDDLNVSLGNKSPASVDDDGRIFASMAPGGKTWYACVNATSAGNTTLKAAVASNRMYVTQFSCASRSAGANLVTLQDGAAGTSMAQGNTVSNLLAPGFEKTFPVPLRGSVNTLLNIATTDASSVWCCASGYISVN
jgi:hypothetical protein